MDRDSFQFRQHFPDPLSDTADYLLSEGSRELWRDSINLLNAFVPRAMFGNKLPHFLADGRE
jgi:hypothetical protein